MAETGRTDSLLVIEPDSCCASALAKAIAAGKVSGDVWEHKRCGCEWRGRMRPDGITVWCPVAVIQIWR
jgi:hypothetical protein